MADLNFDFDFNEQDFLKSLTIVKQFTPEEWAKIENEINTTMKEFSLQANANHAAAIREASQTYLTD